MQQTWSLLTQGGIDDDEDDEDDEDGHDNDDGDGHDDDDGDGDHSSTPSTGGLENLAPDHFSNVTDMFTDAFFW